MPRLAHDDVQEGQAVADDQQRLGLFQAHAGAQPAVELEQHRPAQGRPAHLGQAGRKLRHIGQRLDRRDVALGDQAGLPPCKLPVVVLEGAYGNIRQAFRSHPFGKRPEISLDPGHLPPVQP